MPQQLEEVDAEGLEAAARAVYDRYRDEYEGEPSDFWCKLISKDAITAYLASLSARGMKVVPREPSALMSEAGETCDDPERLIPHTDTVWRAMWDASPPAQEKPDV